MLLAIWILLIYFPFIFPQYSDKPPPTINTSRKWTVLDTTPIGEIVGKVSTSEQNDDVIFGLEHAIGFNIIESDPVPLPFSIDPKSGYVRTNQSLLQWDGKNDILMFVTAKHVNSQLTSKYQIWVQIQSSSKKKNVSSIFDESPKLSIISNFPDYKLPIGDFPQKPLTRLHNFNNNNNNNKNQAQNITLKPNLVLSTTASHINNYSVYQTENTSENFSLIKSTTNNVLKTAPKLVPPFEQNNQLIIALIPLILIFTSLFISGIFMYLFRKRICKQRNKIKKDDLKKSACSILSLEESLVLKQWQNKKLLNNRFNSWDLPNYNQDIASNINGKILDKWEIPRHHIKVFSILGEGCFGQVWKCEALNIDNKEGATVVAVKMLKENAGEQERDDLLKELQVMKMLDPHPNVVRLLGCCSDRDPIFLIMEYISRGKLQSYLRSSRAQRYYNNMHGSSNLLTSRDLTSFCHQIAKGMQYLSSKGIIHRDLAARNILVSENHTCKVADFGFARDVMASCVYERKSEGRLPIRWMAPESLYDNIFSVKSDVWSYGILIWEVVTLGSTPYPGIPAAEVMQRVKDGYRLDKPEHCRRELYNIMYYCWDKNPEERPSFSELVDFLEQLLLTESDYIQLDRFPDHSYYNMVSLSGEKL